MEQPNTPDKSGSDRLRTTNQSGFLETVNSHHFGLGALELEQLQKNAANNVATHRNPSNKFSEKVKLHEIKVKELLMENRLKTLQREEERLRKQEAIANKHTDLAQKVTVRRAEEQALRVEVEDYWRGVRESKAVKNIQQKEENKKIIAIGHDIIARTNQQVGHQIKAVSKKHGEIIAKEKLDAVLDKKAHATVQYAARRNVLQKTRYDKEAYLDSVARVHAAESLGIKQVRKIHEGQLKKLEDMESGLINQLNQTLAKKNAAIDKLNSTSPPLRRSVQPRGAYNYVKKTRTEHDVLAHSVTKSE